MRAHGPSRRGPDLQRRPVETCSITARSGAEVDLDAALHLYGTMGWTTCTDRPQVLRAAMAGSSHVVLAHDGELDGALVELARVISDGASVAYLQDILVRPDHRRAGLGAASVTAVMSPSAAVRLRAPRPVRVITARGSEDGVPTATHRPLRRDTP